MCFISHDRTFPMTDHLIPARPVDSAHGVRPLATRVMDTTSTISWTVLQVSSSITVLSRGDVRYDSHSLRIRTTPPHNHTFDLISIYILSLYPLCLSLSFVSSEPFYGIEPANNTTYAPAISGTKTPLPYPYPPYPTYIHTYTQRIL